jgi:hypothetical protein
MRLSERSFYHPISMALIKRRKLYFRSPEYRAIVAEAVNDLSAMTSNMEKTQ